MLFNMRNESNYELVEALQRVLEAFPDWSKVEFADAKEADYRVRATVHGKVVEFLLEVKSGTWRAEALEQVRVRLQGAKRPIVVASAWIPPKLGLSLRQEQKLNYLDTAGNAYLNFPGLHVFRETSALPQVPVRPKRPVGEAFNASAVRVGLQLLLDPSVVEASLRTLAALAGVSAPSAKFALDAFKRDGYVVETGKKGRRLVEREAFFRKWADSYNLRYRPRRILGRYSSGVDRLVLDDSEACWGGEDAANLLTHHLKPQAHVVYAYAAKIGALVAKNRMRSDPKGDVQVVRSCWDKRLEGAQMTAPVFVVYADLLDTRDPRCEEVAQRLLETSIRERLNG